MEFNDIKTKQDFRQTIFLILMVVIMLLLVFALITLIKNKDIIAKDPLNYGMKVHNFTTCTCYDASNKIWESADGGFIAR